MFYLTTVNRILRNCHSLLARQYIKEQNRIVTTEKYLVSTAKMDIWRNCTEERSKVWNESMLCYVYTMSPAATAVTISATVDETG